MSKEKIAYSVDDFGSLSDTQEKDEQYFLNESSSDDQEDELGKQETEEH